MHLNKSLKLKYFFTFIILLTILQGCKKSVKKTETVAVKTTESTAPFFKLSLAQWSLHKYVLEEKT